MFLITVKLHFAIFQHFRTIEHFIFIFYILIYLFESKTLQTILKKLLL